MLSNTPTDDVQCDDLLAYAPLESPINAEWMLILVDAHSGGSLSVNSLNLGNIFEETISWRTFDEKTFKYFEKISA